MGEWHSPGTVLTAQSKSVGLWAGRQGVPTSVLYLLSGKLKIGIGKWAEDEEYGTGAYDKGVNR